MNRRTPSKMQERSDHAVQSRTVSTVISEPYKSRLPFYNGKGDWRTFMIQLQIIAERNNWSPHQQAEEILLVLKDEALNFATELTPEIRSSFRLLNAEMERRFGNNNFPETYRRELLCAKKQYKETIHEYAARIENMVRKAYPGMDRQLFNNLSIEYMLAGLPDQSIAYDVMTKRPTTMEETINLVTWHLTCKSGMRGRTQVRAIEQKEMDQTIEDVDCRRVGNRYVTEERLNQFGRDIKESMTRDIVKSVGEIIDEKMSNQAQRKQRPNTFQGERAEKQYLNTTKGGSEKSPRKLVCFGCNKEGHFKRDCPMSGERQQPTQNKMNGERHQPTQNKTSTLNW